MKKIIKYAFLPAVIIILLLPLLIVKAQGASESELSQGMTKTRQEVEKRRMEAQDKVKQIREKLQQRVDKIKDSTKKNMAARVLNQLDHVNKVWTNHFALVLDHLDTILRKIENRTEKAKAAGKNVSEVNAAIQKAKDLIEKAKVAVTAQAQKTYLVDASVVGGDTSTTSGQSSLMSKFRSQFKKLSDQLRKDLFALRDGVMKEAREAVHDAARALAKIPNVDMESAESSNNQ